jgi:hypothetical protein
MGKTITEGIITPNFFPTEGDLGIFKPSDGVF